MVGRLRLRIGMRKMTFAVANKARKVAEIVFFSIFFYISDLLFSLLMSSSLNLLLKASVSKQVLVLFSVVLVSLRQFLRFSLVHVLVLRF